jgi:hypothetical protein
MAQDFLLDAPKGITALTLTLLGYATGMARQYIVTPSPVLRCPGRGAPCGCRFTDRVVLLGQLSTDGSTCSAALLSGLYNAILTSLGSHCPPGGRGPQHGAWHAGET